MEDEREGGEEEERGAGIDMKSLCLHDISAFIYTPLLLSSFLFVMLI